jgi:hypothetical protein
MPIQYRVHNDVLELGTAERIDAVATMDAPGVYVLGTPKDSRRAKGMGIVVEYANRGGTPQWVKPPASHWDYTIFGERRLAPKPDNVIPLVIRRAGIDKAGFERWTINGKHYDAALPPTRLTKGRRQRLIFDKVRRRSPDPLT